MRRFLYPLALLALFAASSHNSLAASLYKWGPNVVEFGNALTFERVRGAFGGPSTTWIPYTVMIPGATDAESAEKMRGRLVSMLQASATYNMYPVTIRVTVQGCDSARDKVDQRYATTTANVFLDGSVQGALSSLEELGPVVVEWGSEVNLGDSEWGGTVNAEEYKEAFNAFEGTLKNGSRGRLIVSKAPLNTSNPDTGGAWEAEKYYQALGAGFLAKSEAITSHPYKLESCGVSPAERCTENAWRWDKSHYTSGPNGPIVLTEFGPDPGLPLDTRMDRLEDLYNEFDDSGVNYVTPMMYQNDPNPIHKILKIPVFYNGSVIYVDPDGEGFCTGEDCLVTGEAKTYVTSYNGGVKNEKVKKISPEIVEISAGDDIVVNQQSGTTNITPNSAPNVRGKTTEANNSSGRYSLTVQCADQSTLKVVCGKDVLETINIKWKAQPKDPTNRYRRIANVDLVYYGNLSCNDNDPTIAAVPIAKATLPEDPPDEQNEPETYPREADYFWDRGSVSDKIKCNESLNNALQCVARLVVSFVSQTLIDFGLTPTGLSADKVYRDYSKDYTIFRGLGGIVPGNDLLPSCDTLLEANKKNNTFNMEGAWFLWSSPIEQEEQIKRVLASNKKCDVCTKDGKTYKLRDIAPPSYTGSTESGGEYSLPNDYFPRYMALLEGEDCGQTVGKASPRVPAVSKEPRRDEQHTCSGPGCKLEEDNNTSEEASQVDFITSEKQFALRNDDPIRAPFVSPVKDTLGESVVKGDSTSQPGSATATDSGIYRTRGFGEDYVCPEGRDEKGVCTRGGLFFALYDKLSGNLSNLIEFFRSCALPSPPPPPDSSPDEAPPASCTIGVSSDLYIEPRIKRKNYLSYPLVANLGNSPAAPLQKNTGCLSVSQGITDGAHSIPGFNLSTTTKPTPITQGECGNPVEVTNVLREVFQTPASQE